MVEDRRFREDLYYRLSAAVLTVPPLRGRREDILPARSVVPRADRSSPQATRSRVSPDACKVLEEFRWPGNVRQLRNVIYAAGARCDTAVIGSEHLDAALLCDRGAPRTAVESAPCVAEDAAFDFRSRVRRFEQALIRDALCRSSGNQRRAAALLKLPHRTLVYKIRALGIARDATDAPERDDY